MFTYPIDKKTKDGKLFWSQPKRPPVAIEYDEKDRLCNMFVVSYACLYAKANGIQLDIDGMLKDISKEQKVNMRDEKVQ